MSKNNKQNETITIRLSHEQKEKLKFLANKKSISLTELILNSIEDDSTKTLVNNKSKFILSIILNPSIDFEVMNLDDNYYETSSSNFSVGGRGLLIPKILEGSNLNITTIFFANKYLKYLYNDFLIDSKMKNYFILTNQKTRINIRQNFNNSNEIIFGTPQIIEKNIFNKIWTLLSHLKKDDYLILNGSFHKNNKSDIDKIYDYVNSVEINLIINSSENYLTKENSNVHLFITKVNSMEEANLVFNNLMDLKIKNIIILGDKNPLLKIFINGKTLSKEYKNITPINKNKISDIMISYFLILNENIISELEKIYLACLLSTEIPNIK